MFFKHADQLDLIGNSRGMIRSIFNLLIEDTHRSGLYFYTRILPRLFFLQVSEVHCSVYGVQALSDSLTMRHCSHNETFTSLNTKIGIQRCSVYSTSGTTNDQVPISGIYGKIGTKGPGVEPLVTPAVNLRLEPVAAIKDSLQIGAKN